MKIFGTITLLICLMVNSAISQADSCEDSCNAVLKKGVFRERLLSKSSSSQSTFLNIMCKSVYSEERENIQRQICRSTSSSESKEFHGEGSYIEIASGSSDVNVQKAFKEAHCDTNKKFRYDEWSEKYCHNKQGSNDDRTSLHEIIQEADIGLLGAWVECKKSCKKGPDLICYAVEHGDFISFTVDWSHRYAKQLTVNRFTYSNLELLGATLTHINKGQYELSFRRIEKKRREASLIQLSATETIDGKKHSLSCKYLVPKGKCKRPLYKSRKGKACGLKGYKKKAEHPCRPIRWETKEHSVCGPLFHNRPHSDCGTNRSPVAFSDGGCAQCGGECERRGGGVSGCIESRTGTWPRRKHPCKGECVVPRTCRTAANGREGNKRCSMEHPDFRVVAWEECEDISFGKIWHECRDISFGLERCMDDDPPPEPPKEKK